MSKSALHVLLVAVILCVGFLVHAVGQSNPTVTPMSPPPMRGAMPSSEVERPAPTAAAVPAAPSTPAAQKRRPARRPTVCGNPKVSCPSSASFKPYDLPFRLPANAVIYDTDLFYAVILKSVKAPNDECEIFVPESEREAAQALFPDHKVFASRCFESGEVGYTNISPNAHFMAVYAGVTLADANRMLAAVKATGKFPGAYIRRLRAGVNGT
jgi:hypothetical protein